ncbi:LamG-like jellyroll fold domain-containing protein [Psychroserpens damuponensis]|uniref:LamG-like jellyroll fold domain-containing protein n=1 Tax=Psychroserpens damuponensis TaxID=943936 RepID=UPI00058C082A|nr:LamG-like jellyroll fold domain-containing protein [Psychroserpens damuponensis]
MKQKLLHIVFFLILFTIPQFSFTQDTDGDTIVDSMDEDSDNDGILDSLEKGNSTVTTNECGSEENFDFSNLPTEIVGDNNINTLLDGEVFRFAAIAPGVDGLLSINSRVNATCPLLDDNSSQVEYLKPGVTCGSLSNGQEGYIEFNLEFVSAGTTNPIVIPEFFINLNDIDGDSQKAEIIRIPVPYSYVVDNPTDVTITQENDFLIATSGYTNYQGTSSAFSTINVKARYFDKSNLTFQMGILARANINNLVRYFSLEFSCVNNFTDPQISFSDADNDGISNYRDIDSDNDGIPDNVEAQSTVGYVQPSGTFSSTGVDANYTGGLTPIDTDGDGIPDFLDTDSDNDGTPDILENGLANSVSGNDDDNDGLDNNFEIGSPNDPVFDVNESISNPSTQLPDADSDVLAGGDVDYRDLFDVNPTSNAQLDFDGEDDYLTVDGFVDGLDQVTIMTWAKIDNTASGTMTIAGEDLSCRLYIENGNTIGFLTKTVGNTTRSVTSATINKGEWHHITGVFSSLTGRNELYIDGELVGFNTGSTGANIEVTSNTNGAFEIGRRSSNLSNKEYFKGELDEVRVFNKALSATQIQQMVFQEISNVSGNLRGTLIDKDIIDYSNSNNVLWSNLLAYYPMSEIKGNTIDDYSAYGRSLKVTNISSVQLQTAPMPFQTIANGDWSAQNTWLHGDIWDIENAVTNKDWSIVHIKNEVTSTNSHTNLGLFIDANQKLTINGDHKVDNTWYFELNGTLDLQDDSQLIQGNHSDLVTSSVGKILRRQEGASSVYWYNYWASPVGAASASTLTDNNTSSSNTNNSNYKLNLLKKGDGSNIQFTTAHDEVGKVSTRWTYLYENGVTYNDYVSIDGNTNIQPGVGYTQKGTGNSGSEQQYIFEGKPNNGTILVNVTDTGGSGSVPGVSRTDYLLGNPYPSAIDLDKFILDNAGITIAGPINLWQQWSGNSHYLDEYNGGYATYTLSGSVRASQFVGFDGGNSGGEEGTKLPTRYLPVGQGFTTEIIANGNVIFSNSQRVFVKEADADGTSDNGSVFLRTSENTQDGSISEEHVMQKIRLEFNSVNGPAARRELLLAFSDITTDDFDYGYEAGNSGVGDDDMSLVLDDQLMLIQAYAPIVDDKVVPLVIKTSGAYNYTIKITDLVNFDDDQDVYIKDNVTGETFDLRNNDAYEFSSESGTFNNRFEIVFQPGEALSTVDQDYQYNLIYFNTSTNKLYAKGLQKNVEHVQIINMLGQTVQEFRDVDYQDLNNGLQLNTLSTGTYVAYFKTENGIKTKKILAQ